MASFMDLPAEVRNSIYSELYVCRTADHDFDLLTASKLINEEAASYFYQQNAFTVSLPTRIATADILSPIPNKYLKYVRRLTIDVYLTPSTVLVDDCAQRIAALSDSGATLSALTFRFYSTTSRILSNRVDDYVLPTEHPITLALRHILASGIAQSVRVELDNIWFAPGIATQLQDLSPGSLQVVTSASSIERALLGQIVRDHLHDLDLDEQDVEDAENLPPSWSDRELLSNPSPLSSALLELDTFSPADTVDESGDEDAEAVQFPPKGNRTDSVFDEPLFDTQAEELDETDDVDDEDMEDIDDVDAIFGSMEEMMHYRANEADVCYMTNFAPELLGRWLEESP